MSVKVEKRAASEVGHCQARGCLSSEVNFVEAGDATLCLCDQCMRDLIGGVAITSAAEIALRVQLGKMDDKLEDARSEIRDAEREIKSLKERIKELEKELSK
jgi:septal ring factor EnvC (AmiA/AmiB activator)